MEQSVYAKERKKSARRTAVYLVLALALLAVSPVEFVFAYRKGVVHNPWFRVFTSIGVVLLINQVNIFFARRRAKRRMAALGVDDMAIERFEREYATGRYETVGPRNQSILTDNWLLDSSTGAVGLYPLREVVRINPPMPKSFLGIPSGDGARALELHFTDGGKINIMLSKRGAEQAVQALAARVSQFTTNI